MATVKVQTTIKLLVDKKENRVLFAEAEKDFVDFLFSLFSMPVGTVVRLLTKKHMVVGCLADLYESVEKLSDTYMQQDQIKDSILKPKYPSVGRLPLMLLTKDQEDEAAMEEAASKEKTVVRKFYRCGNNHNCITNTPGTKCTASSNSVSSGFGSPSAFGSVPTCTNSVSSGFGSSSAFGSPSAFRSVPTYSNSVSSGFGSSSPFGSVPTCNSPMNTEIPLIAPPAATETKKEEAPKPGNGGFVKDVVTYIVMDNLVVTPMSSISIITLLNKLEIHDTASLEDKVVDVGVNEALELLKASLCSKTVLTDVFVRTVDCNVN